MWISLAALFLVQIFFGGLPVASKIVLAHLSPPAVVLLRSLFAAIVFQSSRLRAERLRLRRKGPGRELLVEHASAFAPNCVPVSAICRFDFTQIATISLLALIGISLNQMTLFFALRLTTATAAALIVPFISIFTLVFSVLLKREKFQWLSFVSVVLGVSGVLWLIVPKLQIESLGENELTGNLLCVLSAAFYALFLVLSKKSVNRMGSQNFSAQLFTAGSVWNAIFFAGFYFSGQASIWAATPAHTEFSSSFSSSAHQSTVAHFQLLDGTFWAALAFILVCSTVLAYFLNSWALERLQASTVGGFVCLQTLVGVALGVGLLNEKITSAYWVGGSLILASVLVLSLKQHLSARQLAPALDLPDS